MELDCSYTVKHRGKEEIIAKILEAAQASGATKTRLMYNGYLSYEQLKYYLELLLGDQLLKYDGKSHFYKLTERGEKFLHLYNNIAKLAPSSYTNLENS